jgi:uncharacterized protein (DUF983 family)
VIATVEQRADTHTAPEPAANPLRRGELVTCPVCGTSGECWQWELKRAPQYREWTTAVFRCRGRRCGHTFALREDG